MGSAPLDSGPATPAGPTGAAGDATPAPASEPILTRRYRRSAVAQISGEDLGRIVSLSDGVFAFAMTLLVLSLAVPSLHPPTEGGLVHALQTDWPTFVGYAFAFVMIAIWWIVHNRTYQYIARFDSGLVWLNMILLMQIAVMPFVLSVYTTYSDLKVAVDLFSLLQITLGLTTTGIWLYARHHHLAKPDTPAAASRYFVRRGLFSAAVFAGSIGLSFVSTEAAQLSWVAIFFVQRFLTVEGD
ncbi:MAG TPA: TMEM175 family protein [Thermoplasmata archaeon]|nr:TMEM175 family protein [Thermoplasmata archaeon]